MQNQEKYAKLLEELIVGVDNGDFSDPDRIPDKYTFAHLDALYRYADVLDGGRELYGQLFEIACEAGKNAVRKKLANGEKVKVTFLSVSAAEWPADIVYRLMERDDRFDVSVTNCPWIDRGKDDRAWTYEQNKRFFESKGYRVLDPYDRERDHDGSDIGIYSWKELGEEPDIIIHVTIWYESIPKCFQISNYPLNKVNFYIPYGISTENSATGKYIQSIGFNKQFHNMMDCIFANTKYECEGYEKYQLLGGKNVQLSGYAKMDFFYEKHTFDDEKLREIWKIPEGADVQKIKKVIIAPHHSFLGYGGILSSTFAQNAHFWIYLAQKYQNEIAFVFKPHPNLRCRAVEAKVFSSSKEYDEYIDRWNALPNAKVLDEANYLDLFATSDAMIMDSLSFIAEYLYVQKPLLYLRRPEQAFSELGKRCLSAYEQVAGTDYKGIEIFLTETVLKGNDRHVDDRKKVFEECLDYYSWNHSLAGAHIYDYIVNEFFS